MNILLSAGYDRSLPALLLATGLVNSGHSIKAILVTNQATLGNAVKMVARGGPAALRQAIVKYLSGRESHASRSPLTDASIRFGVKHRSLRSWATDHGCAWYSVPSLNCPAAIRLAGDSHADLMVYGGGGILRREIIDLFNGWIINPHCGPLPEIRGINAIEWALLLKRSSEVTVHLIDSGIDTGRTLRRFPVARQAFSSITELREAAVVAGVQGVIDCLEGIESPEMLELEPDHGKPTSRQCFLLCPALIEILERRLLSIRDQP